MSFQRHTALVLLLLLSTLQYLRDPMSDYAHTWSEEQVCERALLTWPVRGQRSRRGHRGQKGHFRQNCYFSFRLHAMVMGLMHIDQLDTLYKSYGSRNSSGVIWGHRGQKVIFTKNAISPSYYVVWSCDSWWLISLTSSTKVMGLKIHPGSFGVTEVKRSFSLKML